MTFIRRRRKLGLAEGKRGEEEEDEDGRNIFLSFLGNAVVEIHCDCK